MQMVYCGPCPLGSTSPIKVGAWLYNFKKCSIKIVIGTFCVILVVCTPFLFAFPETVSLRPSVPL